MYNPIYLINSHIFLGHLLLNQASKMLKGNHSLRIALATKALLSSFGIIIPAAELSPSSPPAKHHWAQHRLRTSSPYPYCSNKC